MSGLITTDALLTVLWDGTSDLLAAIDRQFTLVASNKAFRRIFLQDSGKLVTDNINILDVLAGVLHVQVAFKQSCESAFEGETVTHHYTLYDESHHPHIYEATHSPVSDEHHQCIGVLHIFRDVTSYIELEEEIKRLGESQIQFMREYEIKEQKMNRLQDNFIAVVSHEFRTTLTGIQGFSELLCEEGLSSMETKEFAVDINTDAQRLSRMIDTVLDLQLMRSGRLALHQELIDLHVLLQETIERTCAASSSHCIRLFSDERLGYCIGDREKLVQMMNNLLSNAMKYSPNGSDIVVRGFREGVILHICVQDHGIGIPEDALTRIFETYNQVSIEKTRHIKGTGLGLALACQIVQMHGGAVWAESELGQGTTVHITLPLQLNT